MRLKKLEIYGFKSFAERVEIAFDNGITGIVGPNGCGKSNISDAVRWVLGEQSAKTLRGAKMEDVIFNGTEKRRRLSYCEVVLTFENDDNALPIDFSEVVISRRVYRNGDSEYAINQAQCRLKDITELFRDTGIGKEGYSLIGQGRIDEILSVKSEDRRQIFEEAAGIVKYKARKVEAERRIDNTMQNLSRVEDIIYELEARIEPLQEQSETAREYLLLRDELKGLELNSFLLRSEHYEKRLSDLTDTLSELSGAIEDATERRREKLLGREEVEQRMLEFETQTAEMREGVQALIRGVEAQDGQVNVLKERMAALLRDKQRLEGELSAAEEGDEGVGRRIEQLSEQVAFEEAELLSAQKAYAEAEAALFEREGALSAREEEIERAKSDLIDAMNRLSDVRSEQSRLSAMKDALEKQLQNMSSDEPEDDGTELFQNLERAKARQAEEAKLKDELTALADNAKVRVMQLGERGEELKEKARTLSDKRQEVMSRLRMLEEMQRDFEGYYNSVKSVLNQAKRMPNCGVRGVVATILNVPKELERAIDMVLGGALQNVVVEREEDAKRMIDFLRSNRLGRATFLPLTSVRGRTLDAGERRVLSMPGCVGLASELVKFDKAYQGIVDNLLGRTVVAKDLDAGIQIMRAGRQAFRLVTLDGDVMHSGGSMTGGSVQSRVTSLLSRERELTEHKELMEKITSELEMASAEDKRMEEERAELKRERAELFDRLHQQDIACAREESHVAAAQSELNAHLQRAQRAEDEKERLRTQLDEVMTSISQMEAQKGDEEDAHQSRQQDIARMQREGMVLRAEVVTARESVSDMRAALAAQTRGFDATKRDRDRLVEQREDMEKLVAMSTEALKNCLIELEEDDGLLKAEAAALADKKLALDAAREELQAAEAQRIGAQTQLKEINDAAEALGEEIEKLTDKRHRGELSHAKTTGEFSQLAERIFEDYELTYEGASAMRIEGFELGPAEKRISVIRARVREMGSVNVSAVEEYRQTMERYEELTQQRTDLLKAREDLQGIIEEILKKMEARFVDEFEKLNENFQETFVRLFGGGRAELRLMDPKDVLNCGIEIVAQPPGKKLQLLSLLSGGERALTAIAILFAMLTLKPTPFCFLDEIEAALDDANIDHFAEYLRNYSRKTQFVVVTHRKGTMERCDALYGVAMEEKGVTRLVSVKLKNTGEDLEVS